MRDFQGKLLGINKQKREATVAFMSHELKIFIKDAFNTPLPLESLWRQIN